MRLLSLEVAGFRGFVTAQVFDLDADAVIVVGANGNCKTSLFDAILWAMSGRIQRLGHDASMVVNKFSETGQARVVLRLSEPDNPSPITITRIFDGKETRVSVETSGGVLRGPEAEGRLIQLIWREASAAASPADSLATVLTRSVYLQQDLVREFIDSVTEQERFTAVSELVGAGRVTDLQGELERAKTAWTKATNSRAAELLPLRSRLSTMDSRLAELQSRPVVSDGGLNETAWNAWWVQLQVAGLNVEPVPMASREAAGTIDAAIKQLDGARRAAERRQQLLDTLARDLGAIVTGPPPNPAPLRGKVVLLKTQIQETRIRVAAEQARAAEVRRSQADLHEKSEQLRALAALALKHLEKRCPICDQEYDVDTTRLRLQSIATAGSSSSTPPPADILPELLATLATQENELSALELDLRTTDQAARDHEANELDVEKRLTELNVKPLIAADRAAFVSAASVETLRAVESLSAAQKTGETFALWLSQAGDPATMQELEQEISTTREKLQEDDKELARRGATGEQAQRVIEALREAASSVVTKRVKEIEPLLGDIYSRIDAHPAFRVVRFLASVVRGRGQLSTIVSDPVSGVECDLPGVVLSSSQMNALAVCTFLSLNLGMSRPPLEATILDDPLQSLDDVNLLGLVDLLRRTKDQRQLFVSTHDERFGKLLARKLRPRSSQQRTVVIELEGWSRTGPAVHSREVTRDPAPLRLMAS